MSKRFKRSELRGKGIHAKSIVQWIRRRFTRKDCTKLRRKH